jgi:hypothetical protein
MELTPKGLINKQITYDEYLESEEIQALRKEMYS